MTHLDIPDDILAAAYKAAMQDSEIAAAAGRGAGTFSVLPSIVRVALEAAGLLLVAAELERLAVTVDAEAEGTDGGYPDGIWTATERLRTRAAELRGEVKP